MSRPIRTDLSAGGLSTKGREFIASTHNGQFMWFLQIFMGCALLASLEGNPERVIYIVQIGRGSRENAKQWCDRIFAICTCATDHP